MYVVFVTGTPVNALTDELINDSAIGHEALAGFPNGTGILNS